MERERRWIPRASLICLVLCTASCSSGLPPMPSDSIESRTGGSGSGTSVGAAGSAAAAGSGAMPMGGSSGMLAPIAGGASDVPSESGMRNVGEPCPMGEVDCRPGLRCVETVVGSRTIRRCALPCTPDEDSECTAEDDSED